MLHMLMSYDIKLQPFVYNLAVGATQVFSDNTIVFSPGVCHFIQIYNTSSDVCEVKINNLATTFHIAGTHIQVFNQGDLHIDSIAFRNSNHSGNGTEIDLQIVGGFAIV